MMGICSPAVTPGCSARSFRPRSSRARPAVSTARYGSRVVAAYQVGRFIDGAALAIGLSSSNNAGQTWRWGLLPSLSRAARRRGTPPPSPTRASPTTPSTGTGWSLCSPPSRRPGPSWSAARGTASPGRRPPRRSLPTRSTRVGSPATTGPEAPTAGTAIWRSSTSLWTRPHFAPRRTGARPGREASPVAYGRVRPHGRRLRLDVLRRPASRAGAGARGSPGSRPLQRSESSPAAFPARNYP